MQISGKRSASTLKHFLLGQYFYDGIKITFGVLLPSIICYQLGYLQTGITISLGALIISITDNPGPATHKRNAMMITNVGVFVMAVLIGFTNNFPILLGIEIAFFFFFFSMFNVYGVRASSVGIAILLVIILGIDQHLKPLDTFLHAVYLLIGGVWYMLFSMLLAQMAPFRAAQQTLGKCMQEVAKFILLKANFYDKKTDIEANNAKIIAQQIAVNLSLEEVREILFKTREILKDSSATGKKMILSFIDLVDLYEHATESHLKYDDIQHKYGEYKILINIKNTIVNVANEISYIGTCIHNNEVPTKFPLSNQLLVGIKSQIDALEMKEVNTVTLKKALVNLRNIVQRLEQIYEYQRAKVSIESERRNELKRFTTTQDFDIQILLKNLSFKSEIFRHAIRVSVVCLLAFIFARLFYTGQYSYWILLTILVILKPAFSLSKKRNYERTIGTVIGGLIGIVVLHFVHDQTMKFVILLVFMLLSYSFMRLQYIVSVLFMTPFIVIAFSFLGQSDDLMLVKERIIDTFLGAGAATLASYFILPSWESKKIRKTMSEMVLKNLNYFLKTFERTNEEYNTQVAQRLSRKELYVASSNLASAFERMMNEPKRKRQNANDVNKFILLNNLFSANVAAISQLIHEGETMGEQQIREFRKVVNGMKENYACLNPEPLEIEYTVPSLGNNSIELQESLVSLVQHVGEIKKICSHHLES
ncbi:MAG: FUSC family membrane protein [Crocinitomicaceae bacterium]|nr:FUSC family membrane protein [Crocinitomicaceae bacterium]